MISKMMEHYSDQCFVLVLFPSEYKDLASVKGLGKVRVEVLRLSQVMSSIC